MKKILVISFHFPPDAAIGAVRPAELAKHLPAHGWTPVVLTVDDRYYEKTDAKRYPASGVKVFRTKKLGSIDSVYAAAKRIFKRKKKGSNQEPAGKQWFTPAGAQGRESLKSILLRYYNSLLVYLPDKEIGWLPFAILRGLKVIRSEKIDAIYTTSPPHSVHLVGLGLKLLTSKPWIADFRDPWEVALKPKRSRSALSERIEKRMERAVVKNCDSAVSVTGRMTERLARLYPEYAGKFSTIPNGYDSTSLEGFRREKKHSRFTIAYAGSLYFGRNPKSIFEAVSGLIAQGAIDKGSFRVRLIGDCRTSDGVSVEKMIKKMGLEEVVEFIDTLPHAAALKEIAMAHAALLIAPAQPLQIPGKVYEYIGLRTAIIAVCGDGATKDLLKSYERAYIAEPDNTREMKEAILGAMKGSASAQSRTFPYEEYERRTIARNVISSLKTLRPQSESVPIPDRKAL